MMAFEIWKNGRKMKVVGREGFHYVMAFVSWIKGDELNGLQDDGDVMLDAFRGRTRADFGSIPLAQGDELMIRLVDASEEDVAEPEDMTEYSEDEE
jgi:hypothetical protein